MKTIPRGLIILRPNTIFLDWLNSCSEDGLALEMKEISEEPTAILIPEFNTFQEAMAYVQNHTGEILEKELRDWCEDKSLWPRMRDFKLLQTWFDLDWCSMVFSLVDECKDLAKN